MSFSCCTTTTSTASNGRGPARDDDLRAVGRARRRQLVRQEVRRRAHAAARTGGRTLQGARARRERGDQAVPRARRGNGAARGARRRRVCGPIWSRRRSCRRFHSGRSRRRRRRARPAARHALRRHSRRLARADGGARVRVTARRSSAAEPSGWSADIRDSGLRILAYTVNDPERARFLAQWGVDAICTDAASISSGRISPISETSNDHAKTRAGTCFRLRVFFSAGVRVGSVRAPATRPATNARPPTQGDGLPWLFVKVGVGVRECGAGALAHGLMRVIQTRPRGIEEVACSVGRAVLRHRLACRPRSVSSSSDNSVRSSLPMSSAASRPWRAMRRAARQLRTAP